MSPTALLKFRNLGNRTVGLDPVAHYVPHLPVEDINPWGVQSHPVGPVRNDGVDHRLVALCSVLSAPVRTPKTPYQTSRRSSAARPPFGLRQAAAFPSRPIRYRPTPSSRLLSLQQGCWLAVPGSEARRSAPELPAEIRPPPAGSDYGQHQSRQGHQQELSHCSNLFRNAFLTLVLQRRFFDSVSFWSEIASRKARPQSCQVCGQGALERCSMSFSCQPSL